MAHRSLIVLFSAALTAIARVIFLIVLTGFAPRPKPAPRAPSVPSPVCRIAITVTAQPSSLAQLLRIAILSRTDLIVFPAIVPPPTPQTLNV